MKKVLFGLLACVSLGASAVDGSVLLTMCEKALTPPGVGVGSQDAFQAGYCIGSADLAFEMLVIEGERSGNTRLVCPKTNSGDQLELVKVVVKHLRATREDLNKPASIGMRRALTRAYPCS